MGERKRLGEVFSIGGRKLEEGSHKVEAKDLTQLLESASPPHILCHLALPWLSGHLLYFFGKEGGGGEAKYSQV